MCYISITLKRTDGRNNEFKIKLSSSELISLETPYYVIVEEYQDKVKFSYVYSDNVTNTASTQIGELKVEYGESSGRVFQIETPQNLNKLDIIIVDDLNYDGWSEVKSNNLKLGLYIYNAIVDTCKRLNHHHS